MSRVVLIPGSVFDGNYTPKWVNFGWSSTAIDVTRRYATYINAPKGQSFVKVATGPGANLIGYEKYVDTNMRDAKDVFGHFKFQALSLHYYAGPANSDQDLTVLDFSIIQNMTRAVDVPEDKWSSYLSGARAIERAIEATELIMDRYDPKKEVAIFVDEWGAFHKAEPGIEPIFQYQQNSLLDAEIAALTLNVFHRHTARVKMANIAQMVNVVQAIILTDKEKMLLTPTYHIFDLYTPFQGAIPYPVNTSNSRYEYEKHSLPAVDITAAKGRDGKLYMALVNLDPHRSERITTNLKGRARGRMLTGPTMNSHNTFEAPETIRPTPYSGSQDGNGNAVLLLPPKSITVVAIE